HRRQRLADASDAGRPGGTRQMMNRDEGRTSQGETEHQETIDQYIRPYARRVEDEPDEHGRGAGRCKRESRSAIQPRVEQPRRSRRDGRRAQRVRSARGGCRVATNATIAQRWAAGTWDGYAGMRPEPYVIT